MPSRAPGICTYPGCLRKVSQGSRCDGHKAKRNQEVDARRPSSTKRGYDRQWRKASKQYLKQNPYCVDCDAEGRVELATVVDHEIDHKGDPDLFWDRSNWRSRCKTHHDRKTWRTHHAAG